VPLLQFDPQWGVRIIVPQFTCRLVALTRHGCATQKPLYFIVITRFSCRLTERVSCYGVYVMNANQNTLLNILVSIHLAGSD